MYHYLQTYLQEINIDAPIREVREFHNAYLVIFEKGYHQRPRFVSKAVVEGRTLQNLPKLELPISEDFCSHKYIARLQNKGYLVGRSFQKAEVENGKMVFGLLPGVYEVATGLKDSGTENRHGVINRKYVKVVAGKILPLSSLEEAYEEIGFEKREYKKVR